MELSNGLVPVQPLTAAGKADRLPARAARTGEAWNTLVNDAVYARTTTPQTFKPREPTEDQTASVNAGTFRTASLPAPDRPIKLSPVIQTEQTELIGFDTSAFPYYGKNPRTGGTGYAGGRYSDNRVLVHVPSGFNVKKPGVIVVFFHGHGATLARDVRDRQQVPKQVSSSGVNAVLVAPQLAYNAADSSAGKFWERGGLKRFLDEAALRLAYLYGDPKTERQFARMPVVIVAYSGGFVPAAWSLHVGGLGNRVRGVVLLDALYGEIEKFSSWIAAHPSAFFVSAYTNHTKPRDDELARILREKGISVGWSLNGPLKPGMVTFLGTGPDSQHRDYVTRAWTQNPVRDVLLRMAAR